MTDYPYPGAKPTHYCAEKCWQMFRTNALHLQSAT